MGTERCEMMLTRPNVHKLLDMTGIAHYCDSYQGRTGGQVTMNQSDGIYNSYSTVATERKPTLSSG